MDEVVRDAIVGRMPDPDALRAGKHFAAVVDAAMADFIAAGLLGRLVANTGFADLRAARAEVGELTSNDAVSLAAARQFQAVVAEVRKPAVLEEAIAKTFTPHGAGHTHRRLGEPADFGFRLRPDVGLVLAADRSLPGNTIPCAKK